MGLRYNFAVASFFFEQKKIARKKTNQTIVGFRILTKYNQNNSPPKKTFACSKTGLAPKICPKFGLFSQMKAKIQSYPQV